MKRAQRHTIGCVRFDKRRKTWNYLWYEHGQRRSKVIGTKQEYPTKASAWNVAEQWKKENKPLERAPGPRSGGLALQFPPLPYVVGNGLAASGKCHVEQSSRCTTNAGKLLDAGKFQFEAIPILEFAAPDDSQGC